MIERIRLSSEKISIKLECSSCGATADAACDCGVAYVPAGERAAKAVAESPDKSNVVIAEEIGVSEPTVRRARKKTTSSHDEAEKRVGKDGKVRRLPKKAHHKKPKDDSNPLVAAWAQATLKTKQEFIRACWTEIKQVRDPGSVMRHRPGPCGASLGTVTFDDEEQEAATGAADA
jgi:hypothetical protein